MTARAPSRGQDGFTLVELIVAMAISLIITGVLVTCVIVGLKNADAAGQRLSNSHDAQIAQSFFTSDATSADLVDVDASDSTCSGPAGDALVVRFRWTVRPSDPANPNVAQVAAYRVRTVGGELQIVRQFCAGSTFLSAALVNTSTLIHGLDPAIPLTVSCTSAIAGSCPVVTPSNPFRTVKFSAQSIQKGTESTDSLSYVLSASRRSSQ